jgi:RpiB/LacA/LacB family sugar-phosphate isomerase
MIYITSDHGGFALKQKIVEYFRKVGLGIADEGPFKLIPEDDYPDYVIPVMRKVQQDSSNRAIVICKNGIGVCIAANKFKDIRAALSWNPKHAESTRNDDDSNVLALPADYISEKETMEIIGAWLKTPFSKEERHIRRINKVELLESNQ